MIYNHLSVQDCIVSKPCYNGLYFSIFVKNIYFSKHSNFRCSIQVPWDPQLPFSPFYQRACVRDHYCIGKKRKIGRRKNVQKGVMSVKWGSVSVLQFLLWKRRPQIMFARPMIRLTDDHVWLPPSYRGCIHGHAYVRCVYVEEIKS